MRKMVTRLLTVALLGLSVAMTGCTGDTNATNAVSNSEYNKTGNIQGKIMDATTGKAIAFDPKTYKSSDMKIYLVRGTDAQTPAKYVYDNTNVLSGEYAFTGVPYTLAKNATYKLVIEATGYQRFESEFQPVAFWGSVNSGYANRATTTVGDANNTLDTVLNRIANIYLYPIGVSAVDYKARIMYNGKPVPAASVVLTQTMAGNATTVADAQAANNYNLANVNNGNRLFPSSGLLPLLTGTTDTDGYVTFAGTNLVLGGQYTLTVLPFKSATFEGGVQLELRTPGAFVVGNAATNNNVTIQMASIEGTNVGYNTGSLYITKTEPSIESSLLAGNTTSVLTTGGVVKIYFNRAVQLNDATTANSFTAATVPAAPAVATADIINYVGYWATLSSSNAGFAANMNNPAATGLVSGLTYPNTNLAPVAPAVSSYTATIAAYKPVVASLDATKTILTLTPQFVANFNSALYYDLKVSFTETATASLASAAAGINFTQQVRPSVSPEGHPEQRYNLFDAAAPAANYAGNATTRLTYNNGNTLNTVVNVTGPRP